MIAAEQYQVDLIATENASLPLTRIRTLIRETDDSQNDNNKVTMLQLQNRNDAVDIASPMPFIPSSSQGLKWLKKATGSKP